ncbi:MAG: FlgD immunoglobulin-like domain containing protein, partial [Candidatus Poribacteria bacterium]
YPIGDTYVQGISVRPDGAECAVITRHRELVTWLLGDPEQMRVTPLDARVNTFLGPFSTDSSALWLTDSYGTLRAIDTPLDTLGGAVREGWTRGVPDISGPTPYHVTLRPDGKQVAAQMYHRIGIWSAQTAQLIGAVDHDWITWEGGPDAAYLPSIDRIVTSSRDGGVPVQVWDAASGESLLKLDSHPYLDGAAVSDDGRLLARSSYRETTISAIASGRTIATLDASLGSVVALSATGKYVAGGCCHVDVWDVEHRRHVARLELGDAQPYALSFTPGEQHLIVRTKPPTETLQVCDIENGELITTVARGGPFASTKRGIIHVVWQRVSATEPGLEVRGVGAAKAMSVIRRPRGPSPGDAYDFVGIDPSGRYVTLRDEDPTTGERIMRFFAADTGALLAAHPESLQVQFTAGGDYLFAKGPNGGRALYRTEEFLNIPSHDVTPRNKALAAWGDVKRSQLLPNYPNPFNPETWIPFDLAAAGPVVVTVYDPSGSVVRRLDLGDVTAGTHRTRERAAYWNGRDDRGESVASGVYTYRVEGPGLSDSGRMLLIK